MTTLQEVIGWLKLPDSNEVIIAEVEGVQGAPSTMYLASRPYTTSSADTPSNTMYDPAIIGGVSIKENLSLNNKVSISYGDIEIDNTYGKKDSWFDYIFVNREIKLYIGDLRWPRTDFYLIFDGVIADISARSLSSINLVLLNKLDKLNNPITEELLPTVNTTNEVIVPQVFGEVFNISPIVTDNVINTLEHQVHGDGIEDVIEVRDNGVPVSITKNLSNGKFTLDQSPYGQITASVQGHKSGTYYNDIANIVKIIVKDFGPTEHRFTDSDIDLTNFSDFTTNNPQPVGIYTSSGENRLTMCNKLSASLGAQLTMTSTGLLRIIQLDIPGSGNSYTIDLNDVEANSVKVSSKPEVVGATKIAYCKNYTVQDSNIAAGVPSNSADLFKTEWLYETETNATTISNYKLSTEVEQQDTLLLSKSDAEAEAARRNALWDQARYIYTMKAYGHMLVVELGDSITLKDRRFGLQAGSTGTVVSISRDWLNNRVQLGVLI